MSANSAGEKQDSPSEDSGNPEDTAIQDLEESAAAGAPPGPPQNWQPYGNGRTGAGPTAWEPYSPPAPAPNGPTAWEPYSPPQPAPVGPNAWEPYSPPAPVGPNAWEPYSPPQPVGPNAWEPYSPPRPSYPAYPTAWEPYSPPQPPVTQDGRTPYPGGPANQARSGGWFYHQAILNVRSSGAVNGVIVYVHGDGWRRLSAVSEAGHGNLAMLAVTAKTSRIYVDYHVDRYGQIDQLVV